jgi:hypothetical protein
MLQDFVIGNLFRFASGLSLFMLTCSVFILPSMLLTFYMTEVGAASLLAGSIGGAVGVGVAYPFDTLKTKAQVYGQKQQKERLSKLDRQRRLRQE